jgi:hypothetical protein
MNTRPSNLFRRFLCPGSAKIEKELLEKNHEIEFIKPEKLQEYTQYGINMHEITKNYLTSEGIEGYHNPALRVGVKEEDFELIKVCLQVVDEIRSAGGMNFYEFELQLIDIGMDTGTADYINIVTNETITLVDFKFGDQMVDMPRFNWQMKAYAVGAWLQFGGKEVRVIIVQPKLQEDSQVREVIFTRKDIANFTDQIKDIITKTEEENPVVVPGLKQCQWCYAKDVCPSRTQLIDTMPRHLSFLDFFSSVSPVERGEYYTKLLVIENWVKDTKEAIFNYAVSGGDLGTWAVMPGIKRRKWKDSEGVIGDLRNLCFKLGKDPEKIIKSQIISPAEAEKFLGSSKIIKSAINNLVDFKEGKPILKKKK